MALLPIPDLEAGVSRVLENCPNGDLAPDSLAARPMAVAGRVVAGWRENRVSGESFGDRVQPGAGDEFVEDSHDVRGGLWVGFEGVESLPDRCFAWIRVLTCIAEAVTVRWSTS